MILLSYETFKGTLNAPYDLSNIIVQSIYNIFRP